VILLYLLLLVRNSHNSQHISVLFVETEQSQEKAYSLYAFENVDNYKQPLSLEVLLPQ